MTQDKPIHQFSAPKPASSYSPGSSRKQPTKKVTIKKILVGQSAALKKVNASGFDICAAGAAS